jgi:hypothetical protein
VSYRCEFHVNGGRRKVIVAQGPQETFDNLALRLAGYVLFWELEPQMEISPKHPALERVEFHPDFIALDAAGDVALWGECGNVSLNKLDKLTRRYPHARIVVLKPSPADGRKMREDLEASVDRHARVEVLSWRPEDFALWRGAVSEAVEVFGEATERSLNLVINQVPLAADLLSH